MSKVIPRYTCQMKNQDFLTNHFLVAMPTLDDPNFQQSVAFICEHNDQGALGLIINRPSELHLSDIMAQMELDAPVRAWRRPSVQGHRGHPGQCVPSSLKSPISRPSLRRVNFEPRRRFGERPTGHYNNRIQTRNVPFHNT